MKERKNKAFLKSKLPREHPARQYLCKWDEIGTETFPSSGVVLMTLGHTRLIIPQGRQEDGSPGTLRRDICRRIHTAHLGESKSVRAAEAIYFWPNMAEQVRATVKNCDACQITARSQPLEPPPNFDEIACRPMEKVSCDLFHFGNKTYLILVDFFSGYTFTKMIGASSSTEAVKRKLQKIFNHYGWPEFLRCDDGAEFRASFMTWCRRAGIQAIHSSAYHSQGNARAENAVQQVKNLLKRCAEANDDFETAYSEQRMSPRACGQSAAQLFFGRQLRSAILPKLRCGVNVYEDARDRIALEGHNRFSRFRRHHLPILAVGQRVWLRDRNTKRWDIKSVVRDVRPNLRSYVVQTQAGGTFLRSRRFVKPRVSGKADGGEADQVDDQAGEEEGGSRGDRGGSNFTNVSSLPEPIGTAGQEQSLREQEQSLREQEGRRGVRGGSQAGEKVQPGSTETAGQEQVFREQEGRGAGAVVRGGTRAVEKVQLGPTGHSRPGQRSYKQALCESLPRMVTRSMARQD